MTETQAEVPQVVDEEQETDSKQIVLSVQNPTDEEMQGMVIHITANYDFDVVTKPVRFNFKRTNDKVTGIETIREPIDLAIPYPSVQGIVNILQDGGKGLELLIEAMENVVNTAARDILGEDYKLNASTFPTDKLSWEFIANMPKAQRRGGGIPKETWEAFGQHYTEVMPELTGKNIEQVSNMAKILISKLANIKTHKEALNLVQQQLAIYIESAEDIADYVECVEFLLNKADTLLNVSPEELLANL